MSDALRYIFWLSLFLIAVAYYVGTTSVAQTAGQQLGNLILDATGRIDSGANRGEFAAYPKAS